jgi:hypothetical protein
MTTPSRQDKDWTGTGETHTWRSTRPAIERISPDLDVTYGRNLRYCSDYIFSRKSESGSEYDFAAEEPRSSRPSYIGWKEEGHRTTARSQELGNRLSWTAK